MVPIQSINNFILNVFNFYNGKINTFNNAVLDINWANLCGTSAGGYSKLPNVVKVNPSNIIRYYNDEELIRFAIIETVIHELNHTDQRINYRRMIYDKQYCDHIEAACEYKTIIYIKTHAKDIEKIFGVNATNINLDRLLQYYRQYDCEYVYRTYLDHIYMCLTNMVIGNGTDIDKDKELYSCLKESLTSGKDIYLSLNGNTIPISEDGLIISIPEFNSFLHRSGFGARATCTLFESAAINKTDTRVDIIIYSAGAAIMCTKV